MEMIKLMDSWDLNKTPTTTCALQAKARQHAWASSPPPQPNAQPHSLSLSRIGTAAASAFTSPPYRAGLILHRTLHLAALSPPPHPFHVNTTHEPPSAFGFVLLSLRAEGRRERWERAASRVYEEAGLDTAGGLTVSEPDTH
eukprot:scaffold15317_cov43-Phaeocystis_antarctica.AAC.2